MHSFLISFFTLLCFFIFAFFVDAEVTFDRGNSTLDPNEKFAPIVNGDKVTFWKNVEFEGADFGVDFLFKNTEYAYLANQLAYKAVDSVKVRVNIDSVSGCFLFCPLFLAGPNFYSEFRFVHNWQSGFIDFDVTDAIRELANSNSTLNRDFSLKNLSPLGTVNIYGADAGELLRPRIVVNNPSTQFLTLENATNVHLGFDEVVLPYVTHNVSFLYAGDLNADNVYMQTYGVPGWCLALCGMLQELSQLVSDALLICYDSPGWGNAGSPELTTEFQALDSQRDEIIIEWAYNYTPQAHKPNKKFMVGGHERMSQEATALARKLYADGKLKKLVCADCQQDLYCPDFNNVRRFMNESNGWLKVPGTFPEYYDYSVLQSDPRFGSCDSDGPFRPTHQFRPITNATFSWINFSGFYLAPFSLLCPNFLDNLLLNPAAVFGEGFIGLAIREVPVFFQDAWYEPEKVNGEFAYCNTTDSAQQKRKKVQIRYPQLLPLDASDFSSSDSNLVFALNNEFIRDPEVANNVPHLLIAPNSQDAVNSAFNRYGIDGPANLDKFLTRNNSFVAIVNDGHGFFVAPKSFATAIFEFGADFFTAA